MCRAVKRVNIRANKLKFLKILIFFSEKWQDNVVILIKTNLNKTKHDLIYKKDTHDMRKLTFHLKFRT